MDKLTRLIIVDDDQEIRNLLSNFLGGHGYIVSTAKNGDEFFKLLQKDPDIDLIILDVMMPGIDGIEICRRLREKSRIPVIMLTAVTDETDRIIGLELGADDYLPKPFNPRELLARIKAILRRTRDSSIATAEPTATMLGFSGWVLDKATRRLFSADDVEVPLSSGTYDILVAFLEHPQRVLSRDQLMDITKNRLADAFDRSIDVQISRLRQKLEVDPKNPQIIKTVRTGGYLFTPTVQKIQKTANSASKIS